MGILTKDAILAAEDIRREEVAVPEWHGSVYVRMLSAYERDAWEAEWLGDDGKARGVKERLRNLRARLCVLVIVDEKGERIFSGDEDAEALGKKSGAAIDRIFAVAKRLNALDQRDIEDLEKN